MGVLFQDALVNSLLKSMAGILKKVLVVEKFFHIWKIAFKFYSICEVLQAAMIAF